jgi:hypothetical protein
VCRLHPLDELNSESPFPSKEEVWATLPAIVRTATAGIVIASKSIRQVLIRFPTLVANSHGTAWHINVLEKRNRSWMDVCLEGTVKLRGGESKTGG